MALDLNIDITTENLCKQIRFSDYTNEWDSTSTSVVFGVSPYALNGYGWLGNMSMDDLTDAQLTFQSLDGTVTGSLFTGTTFLPSVPGNTSFILFSVVAGATVELLVDGIAIMPVVTAASNDVVEFLDAIVNAINASNGGPTDYLAQRSQNLIIIYTTGESGMAANGRVVTFNTTGTLSSNTPQDIVGRGSQTDRSITVTNKLGDGIYEMTYRVTDGVTVAEKSIMFYNDCEIRACLMAKIVSASKESGNCCSGCGAGISRDKVNWLYAQMEATRIMFQEGQYACADAILRELKDKCTNLCYNC